MERADGISDIEGKVARVATSKLGNERVSNLADEPHWCVHRCLGRRKACGLAGSSTMRCLSSASHRCAL